MLRIYACIVEDHDLRLVLVAGLVCLLAALTTFALLEQARVSARRRLAWVAAAGFVSGTGIWSTHFVAMLAFEPNLPVRYDLGVTFLSVLIAVLLCSIGWWIALSWQRWTSVISGAVIGLGIGTMHYVGMAAVTLPGRFIYDSTLVAASVGIGIAVTMLAAAEFRRKATRVPWRSALLFTGAICGLHFTAMAAARIFPDPNIVVPPSGISSQALTVAVVAMALMILSISIAVVLFDRKLIRRNREEAERLRTFADAAIEGLMVIDGDTIVDANTSLLRLTGHGSVERIPSRLRDLFPELSAAFLTKLDSAAEECKLVKANGDICDVEVVARPLTWRGQTLKVLAVRDTTERKEAAARIAHLAYHDVLTGLPNRAVYGEHLARTIAAAGAKNEPVAVLCLDLDGFKAVNDVFGHAAGDELLVQVGQRLREATKDDELVARLGGDEFAIIQVGDVQPQAAGLLSERLLHALETEFVVGEQPLRISCSVGVALYPTDALSAPDLIKNADMALYRAKAEGRGVARFYEVTMDEAIRQRRQLDADLRQAIDRNELSVHYQPLADVETGRITALEALLRWDHPVRGPVGPDEFIPLAEESGFIVKLGTWVLRTACAEAAEWQPSLKLAVNLSPVQFLHGDLVSDVVQILKETGLSADRLELEVTEGLLIKDPDRALVTLRELKDLGVEISMDDFGTGYSSLSYFRMFPFDKVKIDQSFVRDMMESEQSRTIVRSVIGLAHGLGMPVVAEGVETQAQLAALQMEGCSQVQGYFISRPGPIENFERVVVDRAGHRSLLRRRSAG